jgi:hypothetical protein
MGDPGHGVPIGYAKRSKGPFDAVIGEALLYVCIIRYIVRVVIAYEIVSGDLEIGDTNQYEHE